MVSLGEYAYLLSMYYVHVITNNYRQYCEENDTALFTALNLGSLLPLPSGSVGGAIRSLLNITQVNVGMTPPTKNSIHSGVFATLTTCKLS